jgi:transcriptional regulator of acetoin/glycerol metabolism
VERQLRLHEWVVLDGEPGIGKETLVRAVHHRCNPAARLTVLRSEDAGAGWAAQVADELTGAGTLLLEHVDRLSDRVLAELVDVLEPLRESTDPDRAWVVATTTGGGAEDLRALLTCFPRTVPVPPLRQHLEDVPELVAHLVARLTRGSVTCAPEVVRVLTHLRWPGNVVQLHRVLREIVATRRSGRIELRDLPSECWLTTRRVLTPLESLECDAIVEALVDASGNKVEAARRLAMSRATIYRKIRDYGISVPTAVSS